MKPFEELTQEQIDTLTEIGVYELLYGDDINSGGLPCLRVDVSDYFTGRTHFEYSDHEKEYSETIGHVTDFLDIMFAAYKAIGFFNPLEVKILGGISLKEGDNVVYFDPTEKSE